MAYFEMFLTLGAIAAVVYCVCKQSAAHRRPFLSRPGDKCIVCLTDMEEVTMHIMTCGHALCKTPCYSDYRDWRRDCPFCFKIVFRFTELGDDCPICCERLLDDGRMCYLVCEHALHSSCLDEYKRYRNERCPLCATPL